MQENNLNHIEENKNFQKKIILIFVVLTVVILSSLFFLYRLLFTGNEISKNNLIEDMKNKANDALVDIMPKKEIKETFTDNKNWYESKIEYPSDNLVVKNEIFKVYNNFAEDTQILKYTDAKKAREGLGLYGDEAKYAFDANYDIASSTDSLIYLYSIYSYTGGAHGGQSVLALNFDTNGKAIGIEQILPSKILPAISKIAEVKLKEEKKKRMLSSGMTIAQVKEMQKNDDMLREGIVPTRDNYNVAWYSGDDVVIYFGQYQVASYAEGTFEVTIPRSTVNNLILSTK
jgi:Protein of unknown function (DUF3298)